MKASLASLALAWLVQTLRDAPARIRSLAALPRSPTACRVPCTTSSSVRKLANGHVWAADERDPTARLAWRTAEAATVTSASPLTTPSCRTRPSKTTTLCSPATPASDQERRALSAPDCGSRLRSPRKHQIASVAFFADNLRRGHRARRLPDRLHGTQRCSQARNGQPRLLHPGGLAAVTIGRPPAGPCSVIGALFVELSRSCPHERPHGRKARPVGAGLCSAAARRRCRRIPSSVRSGLLHCPPGRCWSRCPGLSV
jgi:hypothetical protein